MTKPVAWRSDVVARRSDGTGGVGAASNGRERHPRRVRRRGGSDGRRAGTATRTPRGMSPPHAGWGRAGDSGDWGHPGRAKCPAAGKGQVGGLGVARILGQFLNSLTSDRHKQLGDCFFQEALASSCCGEPTNSLHLRQTAATK